MQIELDAIITDDAAQIRVGGTNPETVTEYAEAMQGGAIFPAVILFSNGDGFFAADGFHRIAAARKAGLGAIPAEVRQGTLRDAILHAAGANADHGLRRTNADKRRAVTTLLTDPEWAGWSDRKIGEVARVDHKTVASIRRELTGEIPKARKVGNSPLSHANGTPVGGSMVGRLLATLSDEALIAECRRRGLVEVVDD